MHSDRAFEICNALMQLQRARTNYSECTLSVSLGMPLLNQNRLIDAGKLVVGSVISQRLKNRLNVFFDHSLNVNVKHTQALS
jgi:hypothetical protein